MMSNKDLGTLLSDAVENRKKTDLNIVKNGIQANQIDNRKNFECNSMWVSCKILMLLFSYG